MLFPVIELNAIWRVQPKGVLHVGAHKAEEWPQYESQGWLPVTWVEGQSELVSELKKRLPKQHNTIIEAFVWSETGVKKQFNVANNGQSSSLLQFGSHSVDYPGIHFAEALDIETTRLDDILNKDSNFDFINIDLQGVELEALKSLGDLISNLKWIYSEVNRREVYKDCTTVGELDDYLGNLGFQRVATRWCLGKGWGDALYVRKDRKTGAINLKAVIHQIAWYLPEILRFVRLILSRIKYRNG